MTNPHDDERPDRDAFAMTAEEQAEDPAMGREGNHPLDRADQRAGQRGAEVDSASSAASARLLLVGVVAGMVLGAGVGTISLVGDVGGLWFFGMLFGAGLGALLGGVAAVVNVVVLVPRAVADTAQLPGSASGPSLLWQLAVPVPAAAVAAWWVLQSPLVAPLERVLVTAAVAAVCAAWVLWTSAWVLAPLTRGGTQGVGAAR